VGVCWYDADYRSWHIHRASCVREARGLIERVVGDGGHVYIAYAGTPNNRHVNEYGPMSADQRARHESWERARPLQWTANGPRGESLVMDASPGDTASRSSSQRHNDALAVEWQPFRP
jgi:hypothetical protein